MAAGTLDREGHIIGEEEGNRKRQGEYLSKSTGERSKEELAICDAIHSILEEYDNLIGFESVLFRRSFRFIPRGGLFKSNHWSDGVFINRHTNVKVALEIKYQRDGGDAWKRACLYTSTSAVRAIRKACNQPEGVYPVVFILMGALGSKYHVNGQAIRAVMWDDVPQNQILYHNEHRAPTAEELVRWIKGDVLPLIV